MNPGKQILISGMVIGAVGALHDIISHEPLSKVVHGTVVLISLLAIFEALSPTQWGALAGALASLAALVCVIIELPQILSTVAK